MSALKRIIHFFIEASSHEPSSSSFSRHDDVAIKEVSAHCLSNLKCSKHNVLLTTARVKVRASNGLLTEARALLDQGSVATVITNDLAQRLQLKRQKEPLSLSGVGKKSTLATHTAVIHVSLSGISRSSFSTKAVILPSLTNYVPCRVSQSTPWKYVADLRLADPKPFSTDPIDIIIGANLYGRISKNGVRKGKAYEPVAQNTVFGWILSRPVSSLPTETTILSFHGVTSDQSESKSVAKSRRKVKRIKNHAPRATENFDSVIKPEAPSHTQNLSLHGDVPSSQRFRSSTHKVSVLPSTRKKLCLHDYVHNLWSIWFQSYIALKYVKRFASY